MANGPNQPPGPQQPGQPRQPEQPVDEFELMRRRIRQRAGAAGEGRQRELTRRFAALGQAPSGAAFKIRQEAQEATERARSEQLQDINVLEAQTRRAEREGEAQRGLQRELAQTQRQTQLDVESMRGRFGAEQQQRAIEASRQELAQTLASQERLASASESTKRYLGDLDFTSRMKQMEVQDSTARYLGKMELDNQLAIADLDRQLRKSGTDIEKMLAEQQISDSQAEGTLNSFATFVNAIAPLREAGLNPAQISEVFDDLDTGLPNDQITTFIQQNFPEFTTEPPPPPPPEPVQAPVTPAVQRRDFRSQRI
jgi:hypothetical protein